MPQIDPKYNTLIFSDKYLTDPLLMALAWKKSHEYIRSTNWYADNFELDKSSLNLASNCDDWTRELQSENTYFEKLRLVPAPKQSNWHFKENKCPNGKELLQIDFNEIEDPCYCLRWEATNPEDLKLRPLAHIGIKEQTIMTLTMMCLANKVESLQGDPAAKYEDVHQRKIVSYGNRLYCTYQYDDQGNTIAEHNYGATTIYGKYFTDYRKFLQRPYYFAAKALPEKSPDEEVYLVELDLSQFFDLVDREDLISKVEALAQQQGVSNSHNRVTQNLLNNFKNWEWSECAQNNYDLCETEYVEAPPVGLPQGLVASGFLSNIYMLNFDESIQSCISDGLPESCGEGLTLIDYCRYVDDMRLVVVGPKRSKDNQNPIENILRVISNWLKPELDKLNLKLNLKKTKVEIFRGKSKGISSALEGIQSNLSGPISLEGADELVSQLESLLMLSENKVHDQTGGACRFNRLALVEKNVFDVREDTLKRFAANKIVRVLNEKRHFTAREHDENGNSIAGDWDYLQERMARRLVASWSHDPALVLLLKKGLELFPSPKLLDPVLEQLRDVIKRAEVCSARDKKSVQKQAAIARYCLAELFRHSATIIHRKDSQAIPAHANVDDYFELLQNEAASKVVGVLNSKLLSNNTLQEKPFDLLQEQARFLLMVRLDTTLEKSCENNEQDLVFKLAMGFRSISLLDTADSESIASCILIASQLVEDKKAVIRASCCLLNKKTVNTESILKKMAAQDPALIRSIFLHARAIKYDWYESKKNNVIKDLSEQLYLNVRASAKPLKDITSFTGVYQLSSRPDNPFSNEIMALKLFQAVMSAKGLEKLTKDNVIDLSRTRVKFEKPTGFSVPPAYSVFDNKLLITEVSTQPALAGMASHLTELDVEPMQLQRIALALRAVLSGSADPTGFGRSFISRAGYRGLKSTSFKRQLGMMTTPEALVGETAQFSTWLSTLLSKLLRWPGIHVNEQGFDWPLEFTFENVKSLIKKRLILLMESYCQLSGMPVLPEIISPSWSENKNSLTVAMVQSKLPFKSDFGTAGVMLDSPSYREKHRRHVAKVAQLVVKHVEAQRMEKCKDGERELEIDIIVWPELSVHQEDMDVLIQLSRKTHAIVLAGLSFIDQPGIPGPNNCAVWIVPRKHNGNKNEIKRFQGKFHMMEGERMLKVQPWRPYQLMLELKHPFFRDKVGFKMTSSTCFDATDIKLSADLRDKSNALFIPSLNTDVGSFDTMVEALHYHMYQPVVLVNTGEFGGSYAMAPYKERHKRLIAHSTGNNQVAINTFEMNMFDFRRDNVGKNMYSNIDVKTPPAGVPVKEN